MHWPRGAVAIAAIVVVVSVATPALPRLSPWLPGSAAGAASHETARAAQPPPTTPIAPTDSLLAGLVRTQEDQDGTRMAVTWLSPHYQRLSPATGMHFDPRLCLVFLVAVDSPSLNVSAWDLKGLIYLRDQSGKEYGSLTWIPTEDRPIRTGVAAFPTRDGRNRPVPSLDSTYMEIVIRDLLGAREWAFRWILDR